MITSFNGAARSAMSASVLALAISAVLGLGGCDKAPGGKAADGAPASVQNPAAMAKLSAYTESHNDLLDTWGLVPTAQTYAEQDIPNKTAQESILISDGQIDLALEKLKNARALPGGPQALDRAADTLIADLDKLMARLRPLKIYYDSKAYREDGLARGKAEDPLIKAEFQTALTDMQAFSDALDVERQKDAAAVLAALKASGDMLGYDSKLALQQAESLVSLFKSPKDLTDPAVLAKGDAIVADLDKTLADQRQAYAAVKAKAKTPIEQPDPNHEIAAGNLTSLIGDYRDLKQSHKVEDLDDMTKNYNSAVERLNSI